MVQAHLVAGIALGPQRLLLAARIVGDHLVRRVQNVGCGAVVLLQLDDLAVREVLLELQDVADIRAAPAVDGLIVVTHHAQVALAPGHQPHKLVLGDVRVLILVHQNIVELVLIVLQHRRMLAQQLQRLDEQIVEVQGVVAAKGDFIFFIGLAQLAVAEVVARVLQPLAGREHAVLCVGDRRLDGLRREFLVIELQRLRHALDDRHAIILVVDGKLALVAQLLDVPSQDARAAGVEGGHPGVLAGFAAEGVHALHHLPRRLVGEGDGQNLPRGHAAVDQMGDAAGEHAGLAAARARQNKQRPLRLFDGGALLGIQFVQIIHRFNPFCLNPLVP